MNPKYSELSLGLNKLVSFLDKYNEKEWSLYFKEVKWKVDRGNRQGILLLTQMRGGMGSFFDLSIYKINGHDIHEEDEGEINDQLRQLVENVISLAQQIRVSE